MGRGNEELCDCADESVDGERRVREVERRVGVSGGVERGEEEREVGGVET